MLNETVPYTTILNLYNFSCTFSREHFPPKNTTNGVLTNLSLVYIK
jgi:hypothetical protein